MTDMANGYTTINLPTDLIEEIKIWRQAYMMCYCRNVSYAEMIRSMLDSLDDTEPDVVQAMDMIIGRHPELAEKVGKYKGEKQD